MRLDEMLAQEGWSASRLALKVRRYLPRSARKTTPSTIGRLLRVGNRKQQRTASLELALAIEKATEGQVRAEELPLSHGTKRLLKVIRGRIDRDGEAA